jgi:GTP:adenosylcobinamide-phosphate guanylyltransferase
MTTLQVLMPMGGLGTRFRKVGITTPKPLIEVDGAPMFQRALRSFAPWTGDKRVVVVVRADDDAEHGLARQVLRAEPAADIVLLEHDTRGAVETCLEARDRLDPDLPLVIMDCDIAFDSPEYFRVLAGAVESQDVDGLLLSFHSTEPRYSFAEVGPDGLVVVGDVGAEGAGLGGLKALERGVEGVLVDRDVVGDADPVDPLVLLHVEDLLVDRGRVVDDHDDLGLGVEVGAGPDDELIQVDDPRFGVGWHEAPLYPFLRRNYWPRSSSSRSRRSASSGDRPGA